MSVFLDLAMQMCEESEEIRTTGQVKFLDLVTYFSAAPSINKNIKTFDEINRDKQVGKNSLNR